MIKCKPWKGDSLKGTWEITYKIDGVRAVSDGLTVTSRSGKPLYNVDHLAPLFTDGEICLGSFKETIEAVRTQKEYKEVKVEHLYSFDPTDPRLLYAIVVNPSATSIQYYFDRAVNELGYEGIVLKSIELMNGGDTKWYKVKAHETFDVPCLEFLEGTGKYVGMLGKIDTPMGKVGTGFSDEERKWFWDEKPAGLIIEVECNRLTENGTFRHATFKHIRWDKS